MDDTSNPFMSTLTPETFKVIKQGELDYFCGLYCLAMLLKNFKNEEEVEIGPWIEAYPKSPTDGFPTKKLIELCERPELPELKVLGLKLIESHSLTGYEYGIAMIATTFSESRELNTHYVVFFDYKGRKYIADPHPKSYRKAVLLDKSGFNEDWNIEKKDPRWANGQRKFWPGPRWAIGKPLSTRAK